MPNNLSGFEPLRLPALCSLISPQIHKCKLDIQHWFANVIRRKACFGVQKPDSHPLSTGAVRGEIHIFFVFFESTEHARLMLLSVAHASMHSACESFGFTFYFVKQPSIPFLLHEAHSAVFILENDLITRYHSSSITLAIRSSVGRSLIMGGLK